MGLGLGIDTGGTYTDAVLLDLEFEGAVVQKAKALTTPWDLSEGIGFAISGLGDIPTDRIDFASVSTTLATNAMVEGRGGRVCLIAVGYERRVLLEAIREGGSGHLPVEEVRFIQGGHDVVGTPRAPLDRDEVCNAVRETSGFVDAFAVSAHGSVRNPAHESAVREVILAEADQPVVCGHELTSELDANRRAVTTVFNARMIPLIGDLIAGVQAVLNDRKIQAPLMVVKGDGHMMGVKAARERPIETLLSGPAASFIGARHLTNSDNLVVVDMGGTTTDVAFLRKGLPVLRSDGAAVGGWRTHVRAADIATTGIGGDSHIWFRDERIAVGPKRVVPLCTASSHHPGVIEELRMLSNLQRHTRLVAPCDFLVRMRDTTAETIREEKLLRCLSNGPRSLYTLSREVGAPHPLLIESDRLERLGALLRVGLTPTDVLHADGHYAAWDIEAARLGVAATSRQIGRSESELKGEVREQIYRTLTGIVFDKLASDSDPPENAVSTWILDRIWGDASLALRVNLSTSIPIAGIGAPAGAYLPPIARKLNSEIIIPEHSEVANAVGAAMAGVAESVEVVLKAVYAPSGIVCYTVHSPEGMSEFKKKQDALEYAGEAASRLARERARMAGAKDIEVRLDRAETEGTADPAFGSQIFLEARIRATAVGEPAQA